MGSKVPIICSVGSIVVGIIVLVLAVVLGWIVIPDIIEDKVKEETRLVNGSDTYEKWENLPVPILLSVYFFNITNYDDFVGTDDWSVQPTAKEVGPYVWRETRSKHDVRVDEESDSLFYREKITYTFDEKLSNGTENDILTLLNVPLITALTLLDVHPIVRPLSNVVLNSLRAAGQTLFDRNMTVKDVMFDGHELHEVYNQVEMVARLFRIPLPNEILNGKFAFYRGKNGQNAEGEWKVNRGVKDHNMFSIIESVNDGKTSLEPWWIDDCAKINGTDGTMFPPFIEKDSRLYIYVAEICRSIYMEYDSEVKYEGIPGYRFKLPKQMFDGPHKNPDNYCFCMDVKGELNKTCDFSGLGRLFSCKADVPIAISKPHFLDADDFVIEEAKKFGLDPVPEKHDTFLDVEPNTGFPLRVHKRLQVGAEIQKFYSIDVPPFNTIPHTLYPVMWVDESAELDEELVDEIKSKLIKPLNLVKIGKWTLVGIGAFLVVLGVVFFVYLKKVRK